MTLLSTLLEILGLGVLAFGLWLLAPWLGVTVAGLGMVALGFALDVPGKDAPQ